MARSFAPLRAYRGAFLVVAALPVFAADLREARQDETVMTADDAVRKMPAPAPARRYDQPGYRLLVLGEKAVKWGEPVHGTGAVIRFAFVTRRTERPGARNCRAMEPLPERFPGSSVGRAEAAAAIVRAMAAWEAAADVRFELLADPADADLLIGAQSAPRGIAFADVRPGSRVEGTTSALRGAAICFNPDLAWETRADGRAATPDIRYVAGHEIGHILGLDHSWHRRALMNFRYREEIRGPQPVDAAGAALLYGRPGGGPVPVAGGEGIGGRLLPASAPRPTP